eukprot:UC4_evm1s885
MTIIKGPVASGKSTLLLGLLGELGATKGRIELPSGSMAFVSQDAWILNATVKDNILFGEAFEEGKYNAILEACALKKDVDKLLPDGDMTWCGDRGVTLSGGQRQRISLARAAYSS